MSFLSSALPIEALEQPQWIGTPEIRRDSDSSKGCAAQTPYSPEAEQNRRRLVLQFIQPGLVGLIDGSVSTLAPAFATAFVTHSPSKALLVGLAASLGAGISMGFAEALSDDGSLSGRGSPKLRGFVCGLMTIAGGIGHTLPYFIPSFTLATALALVAVVLELLTIAWIQWKFMGASPFSAIAKVSIGGSLVLATGIIMGSL